MSSAIREALLNAKNVKSEIVDFPELGQKVKVRGIPYADRVKLFRENMLDAMQLDLVKATPRAIIMSCVDPLTDRPIFEAADADTIASLPDPVVEKLRQAIWRVIGLDPGETEKNSEKTESSGPSTV